MSGNEEARAQWEALQDAAGRATEKSLRTDAAMRLLLGAAMRKEDERTQQEPGSAQHSDRDVAE
jgi:hypothetical protein